MVHDDVGTLFAADRPSTAVLGSYLRPLWLFEIERPHRMSEWLKVVAEVSIDGLKVLITRNGGLFTEIPLEYQDIQANFLARNEEQRFDFQHRVLSAFNQVVCAFTLTGVATEPFTAIYLGRGKVAGSCAAVFSGGGGGGLERTTEPYYHLLQGREHKWDRIDSVALDMATSATSQADLNRLAKVSPHGALFIVIAYASFQQELFSESLVNAWFAVELWVTREWTELYAVDPANMHKIGNNGYLPRVKDMLTDLLNKSAITTVLHQTIDAAREVRNSLAHRGGVNEVGASLGVKALLEVLEVWLGHPTRVQPTVRALRW